MHQLLVSRAKPHDEVHIIGQRFRRERASVRLYILFLACFSLGIAVTALWFHWGDTRVRFAGAGTPGLNEAVRAALQNLSSPVEIRYYALLDPASVPEATRQFSERVKSMLTAYQEATAGSIKVTCFTNVQSDAEAASSDGLKPFNLDKGDACYLGMAIVHGQQKEIFRDLSPQWEPALGYDICRAVAKVATTPSPTLATPPPQTAAPAAIAEVRSAISNLDSISLADAEKRLRLAAFEDFTWAVQQMESERKAAEERLKSAQQGNSEAERQAANENLRKLQAEQAEKLKAIAAKSQAQIDALQQIKAGQR